MKYCNACGMPINDDQDFCQFCTNADGTVKSCEEIFESGVQYFLSQFGDDRQLAERITRKNMLKQPYWQGKDCDCFKGEVASDEEFAKMMEKLK